MTTIDEVREIISKRALKHVRECDTENINQYLVIQSFTGSGKSVSVMKSIDEANYNWMYFAPFHDIIKENIEYSKYWNYDFAHMKGKDQEGVCESPEYKGYAQQGINITPFCEMRCAFRHNGCKYYEIRDQIESYPLSWAGVHAHIPTYLQSFLYDIKYQGRKMFNHYDVIIIDEFPFQCLFDQVIIDNEDISYLRNVLSYMTDSDEKWFINTILEELLLSTDNIPVNHSKIKNLMVAKRTYRLQAFYEDYEKKLLSLVSNKMIARPPKQILHKLIAIYEQNPPLDNLKWMLYRHKWDGWNKPGIYMTVSKIDYFKNIPVPIIALDATADIQAWNTLLNDNCYSKKIDMTYKNLYQMKSNGRYPVRSWIKIEENKQVISDIGKNLCDLIIEICNRKESSVLLCSNKRIRGIIQEYLSKNYNKDNYMFAIYYNLRSRNEYYVECDTCIITHEPNIPPLQLDIMHNVVNWDVELLRKLMTESEIKQGIGRIRQNILTTPAGRDREKIEVYMLPGATSNRDPFKILEEAILLTYEDMFCDKKRPLEEILEIVIKKLGTTNRKELNKVLGVGTEILKKYLKHLWLKNRITNHTKNIQWDWDEEKEKRIEYKISNE